MEQKQVIFQDSNSLEQKFFGLYQESLSNKEFENLTKIIFSKENIMLAYDSIKNNPKGSSLGLDNLSIYDVSIDSILESIDLILFGEHGYRRKPIKGIMLENIYGERYPIGIPCIIDRIIERCIFQVLDPILEAKFSDSNFAARPYRFKEHALAQAYRFLQIQKLPFVMTVDLRNVMIEAEHSKLIKQLWSLGIHDKTLIFLLKRILKTPMHKDDKRQDKGLIQSGTLSLLLMNVFLNECDQWLDSQWRNHPIALSGVVDRTAEGRGIDKSHAFRKMRSKTNLKEFYFVRYGTELAIFSKDINSLFRLKMALKDWLKSRLSFELSEEKFSIVNAKQKFFTFIGFKIKLRSKRNAWTVQSHLSDAAYSHIRKGLLRQVKNIVNPRTPYRSVMDEIKLYNSMVLGIQNYFRYATDVELDLDRLNWNLMKVLKNRTTKDGKGRLKKHGRQLVGVEKQLFGRSAMVRFLSVGGWNEPIYPLGYIKTKYPICKSKSVNKYIEGCQPKVGKELPLLEFMMKEASYNRSSLFMQNRFSLYMYQSGRCAVTSEVFSKEIQMHCHHITPASHGGTDDIGNLVLIVDPVHKLIHAKEQQIVEKYIRLLSLNDASKKKVNYYRSLVGNAPI